MNNHTDNLIEALLKQGHSSIQREGTYLTWERTDWLVEGKDGVKYSGNSFEDALNALQGKKVYKLTEQPVLYLQEAVA